MLTDAQKRWQRNYYRKVRRFHKHWIANCEKRRKERKAKADPNIEREYYQERNFRFGLTFTPQVSPIYSLSAFTLSQLANPRWKFVLNGRCVREENWKALQFIGGKKC